MLDGEIDGWMDKNDKWMQWLLWLNKIWKESLINLMLGKENFGIMAAHKKMLSWLTVFSIRIDWETDQCRELESKILLIIEILKVLQNLLI